jgi:hypothetical protein
MPTSSRVRRLTAILGALLLVAMPAEASGHPVTDHVRVGVAAPDPGYVVVVSALMVDGSRRETVVGASANDASRVAGLPGDVSRVAGGPAACADRRSKLVGFRWTTPYAWQFRASSTPTSLGRARVEAQLLASVRSITTARNDCRRPDRVNARAVYLGRTSRKPGVRVDASSKVHCPRDGRNVVGFGALPRGMAGLTCVTYTVPSRGRGRALEADVLLDKAYIRWALGRRGCSGNEVMLRSVATHEFGHVFGLGHVSEATHGALTMSESIGPCDGSAYTLGLGDILGLERLY